MDTKIYMKKICARNVISKNIQKKIHISKDGTKVEEEIITEEKLTQTHEHKFVYSFKEQFADINGINRENDVVICEKCGSVKRF